MKDNRFRGIDMTDNELNELIEIRNNAPEGATHVDRENGYLQFDGFGDSQNVDGQRYLVNVFDLPNTRSLSDINTIIELEQQKRGLINQLKEICRQYAIGTDMNECIFEMHSTLVAFLTQKDLTND